MRVSRETKERTRARILTAARRLFAERGFEATTTRELAAEAGIATGTLFNYFPSKEVLGTRLLTEAAREGALAFAREREGAGSLEEQLFGLVACQLRHLEECRGWAAEVLESTQSPLRRQARGDQEAAETFRADHLEAVTGLLIDHQLGAGATPVALHLYWTLYLGVLAFWARDPSLHRQDTLALLDRSTRLFARSLRDGAAD